MTANDVSFQNKTTFADHFALLNKLRQAMTYGRLHVSTVLSSLLSLPDGELQVRTTAAGKSQKRS